MVILQMRLRRIKALPSSHTKTMKPYVISLKRALGAGALTGLALSAAYAAFGLFPFGPNSLSWGDMSQQAVPLLMQLKDVLSGRAGLLLNLQNAGGMSFWGVLFFFLASPLHLLVVFVEKGDLYLLVNVLVLLKLALAAGAASWFFSAEAPGLPLPAHLSLCLGYGLCGYGMLYYQNLVWLDVLALFPLVMLGFLRLVQGGGGGLFTAALALTIAVNYYLSYMVLLGLVLWAGVFLALYVPARSRRRFAGRLGLGALTALGITALVWLPSLVQCLDSARTGSGTVEAVSGGSFWPRLTTTLPVLFCTAGAACAPLLFLGRPMPSKARAAALCWGLAVLPLWVDPVNRLWHLGSYQAFPARYGYMPVFFGLWLLAQALGESPPEEVGRPRSRWASAGLPLLTAAGPLLAGSWVLACRFPEASGYTSSLWVDGEAFLAFSVLWLAAGGAVLLAVRCQRRARSRIWGWVLLAAALSQGLCQSACLIGSAAHVPTVRAVVEAASPSDSGLYRVKPQEKRFPVNLLGGMGLPTFCHYTSLTGREILPTLRLLGYSGYWMESTGTGGTGLSDRLLSIRYALEGDLTWTSTGGKNLGLLVPANALPRELPEGGRVSMQNQIYEALTGERDPAFLAYTPTAGSIVQTDGRYRVSAGTYRWSLTVDGPQTLYFDAFDQATTRLREEINGCFAIKVNGRELPAYPSQRENGILDLGHFQDQRVTVEVQVRRTLDLASFGVWGLKDSALEKLDQALEEAGFRFAQDRLEGSFPAGEGQALFLSIPWSSGLRVAVNGEAVQPRRVLGCFLEVPLPAGPCWVSLWNQPPGLSLGALLSALTLLALALRPLLRLTPAREALLRLWLRAAPRLLGAAAAAALALVYVLPPLLWVLSG